MTRAAPGLGQTAAGCGVADLLGIRVAHPGGQGDCAHQCDDKAAWARWPLSVGHRLSLISWSFPGFAVRGHTISVTPLPQVGEVDVNPGAVSFTITRAPCPSRLTGDPARRRARRRRGRTLGQSGSDRASGDLAMARTRSARATMPTSAPSRSTGTRLI